MPTNQDSPRSSLPVVDLEDPNAPSVLRRACEEYGFFYLINHGVEPELLKKVFEQSKLFFALPEEEKLKVEQRLDPQTKKMARGYTKYQEEVLDPAQQTQGDTKEGFYIGQEPSPDNPDKDFILLGPNQWPDAKLLPDWKPTMEKYYNKLLEVGLKTVRLMCKALQLDTQYLDEHFTHPMAALRLLRYSAVKSVPEEGLLGCGAHSDYGMYTFLATDENPGLQVYLDGEWKDVQPYPGAYIVNLGDMLSMWTNDTFRSTVHRVIITTSAERYSIPFFYEPNPSTRVTCLPGFHSTTNPPKYPPTTSGEYLVAKYEKTHKDFPKTA